MSVVAYGGGYLVPSGHLRLWRKPGGEQRNGASATECGDFIPGVDEGNEENVFEAPLLGFEAPGALVFYLEAVRPSTAVADQRITVEIDPDGDYDEWVWAEDAVRVTVLQFEVDGLRVYDPKLEGNPTAEVKYEVAGPSSTCQPRIELTVLSNTTEVACLVRKTEASPPLNTEITKLWDGKWGVRKDGTDTAHKGLYADPQGYTVEVSLYVDDTISHPLLAKTYPLYMVRLGIVAIAFLDDAPLQYPFESEADWTTNSPGLSEPAERYSIPNVAWRLGEDSAGAQGATNLDNTTPGAHYGEASPEPEPWGGSSTGSAVQAVVDQLYWPPSETGGAAVEDDAYNYPVCYVFTTPIRMDIVIGQRCASQVNGAVLNSVGYRTPCAYPVNISDIRRVGAGGAMVFSAAAGSALTDITPGSTIQVETLDQLDHTVGKEATEIRATFSYTNDGQNVAIPGFQEMSHTVYRIAGTPQPPQDVPWVCVLDKAVDWAGGADSAAAVQTSMEAALNTASGWHGEGQMPLEYDIVDGEANYAVINAGPVLDLNLANFMMFLHRTRSARESVLLSGPPPKTENTVNCLDCAALLPCFANAAGGDLSSCLIAPSVGGFRLNPVRPVGWHTWRAIGLLTYGAFSYHAVTIEGVAAPTNTSHVYDSCLMLGSPDPTQYVNGAIAQPGQTRFSNGSVFDAPNSLTLSAAVGPGGGKGTLNGRPSNAIMQADIGPDSELAGINASYVVTLTAPLEYSVNRLWTAPAGTNNEAAQAAAVPVRVPPAVPGAPTDCFTADGCVGFEIVDGAVPFVISDTFTFTSTFTYDGEYRGALAAPDYPGQPAGRVGCVWLVGYGPFVPILH